MILFYLKVIKSDMTVFVLDFRVLDDCWKELELSLTSVLDEMELQARLGLVRLRGLVRKLKKAMKRGKQELVRWKIHLRQSDDLVRLLD